MSVTADLSMIAAVASALFAVIVLFVLLVVARATAFSRHIDERRVRRARFQDEWSQVIKAAGDFARASDRRGR